MPALSWSLEVERPLGVTIMSRHATFVALKPGDRLKQAALEELLARKRLLEQSLRSDVLSPNERDGLQDELDGIRRQIQAHHRYVARDV